MGRGGGREGTRKMRIQITKDTSQVAGFISWKRLAEDLFRDGKEITAAEKVVAFEISERGINFFIAPTALASMPPCDGKTATDTQQERLRELRQKFGEIYTIEQCGDAIREILDYMREPQP